MFGPGGGGGWNILGPGAENLLEKVRAPPPRPLPLSFPNYTPPRTTQPLSRRLMVSFRSSLLRQKRPTDVCDGLLAHLNIHLKNDIPLSSPDFIPSSDSPFRQRPYLYDSELDAMLAELSVENEDAFRELMRLPPLEGKKKPRLAYGRNFFASLEDMSHYYDDSRDHYYEVEVDSTEQEGTKNETPGSHLKDRQVHNPKEPSKDKGKVDDDGDSKMTDGDITSPPALGSQSSISTNSSSSAPTQTAAHTSDDSPSTTNSKTTKQVYKGHRLGNSLSLPPQTRTSLVRSLLKMAIHTFNCRDYDPSGRERLRIKDINMPQGLVGCTFEVVMTPRDVKLARARVVQGPVFGVGVRHDAVWREKERATGLGDGEAEGGVVSAEEGAQPPPAAGPTGPPSGREFVGEKFDLAREVGAMLHIALQRNREGQGTKEESHDRETQDWWWAKNQRWGGAEPKWGSLPFEVFEDEDPSWSPHERELQVQKRKEAAEEMKRLPMTEGDASGKEIKVEDLIASPVETATNTSASIDEKNGGGRGGGESERAERGPPKKKNRITERPRRGGGSGGGGSANGRTNDTSSKSNPNPELRDGKRVVYVPPLRKKWYKDWESIRPNVSTWDDKMVYKRIGCPPSISTASELGEVGGWDDVFYVSCVNHHVRLLKMRVSARYLRWLETGEVDQPAKEQKGREGDERDMLRIWRSEWFDLFEVERRKEFLEGIWRVMGWLCREDVPKGEWEKMESLKGERDNGVDGGEVKN